MLHSNAASVLLGLDFFACRDDFVGQALGLRRPLRPPRAEAG